MNANHPLDLTLQGQVPTVMVPKFGAFTPLRRDGHRFLAASNGLWLEARRPWVHLIWPVALQDRVAMPYGDLQAKIDLTIKLPMHLFLRFAAEARDQLPNEHAAWITCRADGSLAYRQVAVLEATPDRHRYHMPTLEAGEHPFIDLHSHGRDRAYFSPVDDASDFGEYKIAAVLGHCHRDTPQLDVRLCAGGLFIPLLRGAFQREDIHAATPNSPATL